VKLADRLACGTFTRQRRQIQRKRRKMHRRDSRTFRCNHAVYL